MATKPMDVWAPASNKNKADILDAIKHEACIGAASILRLSHLYMDWLYLGGDIAEIREICGGLVDFLHLVASRRLHEEAVFRLFDQKDKLLAISSLPFDDQKSLATGEKTVAFINPSTGKQESRPFRHIPQAVLAKVVSHGNIVSIDDQKLSIKKYGKPATKAVKTRWVCLLEQGLFKLGNAKGTIAGAFGAVSEAFGVKGKLIRDKNQRYKNIPVEMTDDEYANFTALCKSLGKDSSEELRKMAGVLCACWKHS